MITDYDSGGGKDYFENIDFTEMDEDELAALAPRRRYLIELERMLDVELPATTKTHVGDNWKKSSPNITNKDLKQIIVGLSRALGEPVHVAKEVRRDIVPFTEGEEKVYRCIRDADEMLSRYDIAEQLEIDPSTVGVYLKQMRDKMDFTTKREGKKVLYGIPPGYRDLEV